MAEFRPGGFNILPPVIKNLLIINTLVFIAQSLGTQTVNPAIERLFALHPIHAGYFKPWQLVTYMFLHADFFHIFWNMFALWMFGSALENLWGSRRFLIFYLVCGIGAAVLHLYILNDQTADVWAAFQMYPPDQQEQILNSPDFVLNQMTTIGASGAVFGCLAAFGYTFPNDYLYVYGVLPVKAKWLVILYAGSEVVYGLINSPNDHVAHWAHIGGGLVGLIIVVIWKQMSRRRSF